MQRSVPGARRLIALLPLATLCATGVALAGPAASNKVGVAKRESGPYTFGGTQVTVDAAARSFYFKIANKTDQTQQMTLEDRSATRPPYDYRVRWFRNRSDITTAANGDGYHFKLAPGSPKIFRGYVKPMVDNPGELCLAGAFVLGPGMETADFLYVNSSTICG
jgi:hypothetical protein